MLEEQILCICGHEKSLHKVNGIDYSMNGSEVSEIRDAYICEHFDYKEKLVGIKKQTIITQCPCLCLRMSSFIIKNKI